MYLAASLALLLTQRGRRSGVTRGGRADRRVCVGQMSRPCLAMILAAATLCGGCTSTREWWRNGLKVGPNYCRPCATVAENWIDGENSKVRSDPADHIYWWTVFEDPVLDELVSNAYRENLPLKVAALRVWEARAQRRVATGNLFAQTQAMSARYDRRNTSGEVRFGPFRDPFPQSFSQVWRIGFDASWELDFWGRLRREIEVADANLCAELAGYDDVLVILQAEVAATYVEFRTLGRRLELAKENLRLQRNTLAIVESGYRGGIYPAVDMEQAKATAATTESAIPLLAIRYRQAQNRLSVLLGMPPQDLEQVLGGPRPIPMAPAEVVVGIPAELLRRRPDIRRAEREVEAESARIGIATAELYPHFSITGNIGLESSDIKNLFTFTSVAATVGPGLRWNILNYGRILGSIDAQDARFRQSVINYRETVLRANEDVENGMVAFIEEQKRLEPLGVAVDSLEKAYDLSLTSYKAGILDFQRVLDSQRALVVEQDRLAEGQGNVSLHLISVYKALGGGWRVRCPSGQGEFDPFDATVLGEDLTVLGEETQ